MSARPLFGDSRITPTGMVVATAQAVEQYDIVGLASDTIIRASDQAWASAVATPTAPTVADTATATGTQLTNALTGVKISYQFPWGEGALSAAATATPTANASLLVSGTPLQPGTSALWTNVYVETSAGSGTYKFYGTTFGENVIVSTYGNGPVPWAGNSSGAAVLSDATTMTQYNFGLTYQGISNQRKVATVAQIFGNNGANLIQVNRTGGALIVEFDCASTSFAYNQFVGAAKDTGSTLMNQTVAAISGTPQIWTPGGARNPLAIGKCVEDTTTKTKIKVEIL